ncbi:MAG: hypothetical protein ACJA13_000615 [Paraglaciecola sp.]|jgi:hypothetical protein
MRNNNKYIITYLCLVGLFGATMPLAQAQQIPGSTQSISQPTLDQAKLDQMLAPIALYPDTLLSHILIAATYPLEVVQAARWRETNTHMGEEEALQAAQAQDWDPSVQALAPFRDLLTKLSDDLTWLQNLGDAFLVNEAQVLDTVQNLRHKAYAQGNLSSNDYLQVQREQDKIVIQPVQKEIVYVPYYDTTVVYGDWWWPSYQPIYWHSPRHYAYRSGFYWSPRFHFSSGFFFGGVHWANNYVVINHNYRHQTPRSHRPRVMVREYPRWQHDPRHRRSVRYTTNRHQQQQVRSSERQQHTEHNSRFASTRSDKQSVTRTKDGKGTLNHQKLKQRLVERRPKISPHNPKAVLVQRGSKDKDLRPVQSHSKGNARNPAQRTDVQQQGRATRHTGSNQPKQSRPQLERPSPEQRRVARQDIAPQKPARQIQANKAVKPRQGLSRQSESHHRRDTSQRK